MGSEMCIRDSRAYYRHDGERGEQHEVSAFERDGKRWRYVSAQS